MTGEIMSEQTPDSIADFDGDLMAGPSDDNEPSMEDILASIRKIISEDADPVLSEEPSATAALNSPRLEEAAEPLSFPAEKVFMADEAPHVAAKTKAGLTQMDAINGPVASLGTSGTDDDNEFDIDAFLSNIDLTEPETPSLAIPDIEMDDEPVALEIPMMPDDDTTAEQGGDAETDDSFFDRILGTSPDETHDALDVANKKRVSGSGADIAPEGDPLIDMLLSQDLTSLDASDLTLGGDDAPARDETNLDLHTLSYDEGELDGAKAVSHTPRVRPALDTGEDLDLVKSLMADLTDEDAASDGVQDAADEAILSDLLNMAIEDEISRGPVLDAPGQDELPQDEPPQDDPPQNELSQTGPVQAETTSGHDFDGDALLSEMFTEGDAVVSDEAAARDIPVIPETMLPEIPEVAQVEDAEFADADFDVLDDFGMADQSLASIAAAAEADAKAAQTRLQTLSGRAGGVTAADAVTDRAATSKAAEQAPKTPSQSGRSAPETSSSEKFKTAKSKTLESKTAETTGLTDQPEKETDMPSALRNDVILDDVTEEATMSAFAELNNLVEERTVLEERGPRIGDLVQEALKPMLKDWLDDNLQGIVERAVAKEVKRIAAGK